MMKLFLCLLFPPFWPVAIWLWLFSPGKPKINIPPQTIKRTSKSLFSDRNFADKHLNKSIVGNVIQSAVFRKELSAKSALELMINIDKGGLLEVYRNLPKELRYRIAEKICENLAE